jgi:hypothetical protein
MTDALLKLSDGELRDLSSALKSGRVSPPYSPISLERILSRAAAAMVCEDLRKLESNRLAAAAVAQCLDLILSDRARRSIPEELLQLVITGPDAAGAVRDTGVVVRLAVRQRQANGPRGGLRRLPGPACLSGSRGSDGRKAGIESPLLSGRAAWAGRHIC